MSNNNYHRTEKATSNGVKSKAKLNYLRIAPRKVRLVADIIRGKSVFDARNILGFTIKKAAHPMLKLLNSAVANAGDMPVENLFISKVEVNEGPKLKRSRPRARGRAYEIQKKTSHIIIVLDEKITKSKKPRRKAKPSAGLKKHES